jgi:hypothetical protein
VIFNDISNDILMIFINNALIFAKKKKNDLQCSKWAIPSQLDKKKENDTHGRGSV